MANRASSGGSTERKNMRIRLKTEQKQRWDRIKSKEGFNFDTEMCLFLMEWYESTATESQREAFKQYKNRKPDQTHSVIIKLQMGQGALMKCIHGSNNKEGSTSSLQKADIKSASNKSSKLVAKTPKINKSKSKGKDSKMKKENDQRVCKVSLHRMPPEKASSPVARTKSTPARITRNRPSNEDFPAQQTDRKNSTQKHQKQAGVVKFWHMRSKTAPVQAVVKRPRGRPPLHRKPGASEIGVRNTRNNSSISNAEKLVKRSRGRPVVSSKIKPAHGKTLTDVRHTRGMGITALKVGRTLRSKHTAIVAAKSGTKKFTRLTRISRSRSVSESSAKVKQGKSVKIEEDEESMSDSSSISDYETTDSMGAGSGQISSSIMYGQGGTRGRGRGRGRPRKNDSPIVGSKKDVGTPKLRTGKDTAESKDVGSAFSRLRRRSQNGTPEVSRHGQGQQVKSVPKQDNKDKTEKRSLPSTSVNEDSPTPIKRGRGRPRKTKLELRKIDDDIDDEISLDMDVETINDDMEDTISSGKIGIEKRQRKSKSENPPKTASDEVTPSKSDIYDFESGEDEEEDDESDSDDSDDESEEDRNKEVDFIKNLECTTRSGRQVKRSSKFSDMDEPSSASEKKVKKKSKSLKVNKKGLTMEQRRTFPLKSKIAKKVSIEKGVKKQDNSVDKDFFSSDDDVKLEDGDHEVLESTADGDAIIRIELKTNAVDEKKGKSNHLDKYKQDISDSENESVHSKSDTEADDEFGFSDVEPQKKGEKRRAEESDIQSDGGEGTKRKKTGTDDESESRSDGGEDSPRKKTKSGLCTVCGCFAGDIQRHSMMHLEKEKCGLCSFETNKLLTMQAHQIREHQKGEWKFICEECDAGFMLMSRLVRHRNFHHLGLHVYDCDACKKSFETANRLRMHKELVHIKKKYRCKFEGCTKTFKALKHAEYHLRCHTGCKPYHCLLCTFTSSQRNSMNWHMKKFHEQEPSESNFVLKKSELQKINVSAFIEASDLVAEEEEQHSPDEESFSSDLTSEEEDDKSESGDAENTVEPDRLLAATTSSEETVEHIESKEKFTVLLKPDSDEEEGEMQVDLAEHSDINQSNVNEGKISGRSPSVKSDRNIFSVNLVAEPSVGQSETVVGTQQHWPTEQESIVSSAGTPAAQVDSLTSVDTSMSMDEDETQSDGHIMENIVIEIDMKRDSTSSEAVFEDGSLLETNQVSQENIAEPSPFVAQTVESSTADDVGSTTMLESENVSGDDGENINGNLLSSTVPAGLDSPCDVQAGTSTTEINTGAEIAETGAEIAEYVTTQSYGEEQVLQDSNQMVTTEISSADELIDSQTSGIVAPSGDFVVEPVGQTPNAVSEYEVPVCSDGIVMSQSVVGVSEYDGMQTVTYVISTADGNQTVTASPDVTVTAQNEVQVSEPHIYTTADGASTAVYEEVAGQNIPLESSETVVYESYTGQESGVAYTETVYQDVTEQHCEEVVIEDNQLHTSTVPVNQTMEQPVQQYVVGSENNSQLFTDNSISYVNIAEVGNTHDNNNISVTPSTAGDVSVSDGTSSMMVESEQVCEQVVETEVQDMSVAPDISEMVTMTVADSMEPESTVIQDSTLTSTTVGALTSTTMAAQLLPQTVTFMPQSTATNVGQEIAVTNVSIGSSNPALSSPISILRLPGQSLLKKQNYTSIASSLQKQSAGRTVLTIPRVVQTVSSPRSSLPAQGRPQSIRVPSAGPTRPGIVVSGSLSGSNISRVSPAARTQTVYLDANSSPSALSNSSLLTQRVALPSGGTQMIVLDGNRPHQYILPSGQPQVVVSEAQQTLAPSASSVVIATTQSAPSSASTSSSNIITAYLDPSGTYWTTQSKKN